MPQNSENKIRCDDSYCITLNIEWKMPKHFGQFVDNLKFTVKISYGKDAKNKNKWDFSLVLNVRREFDDITSAGKLFHVRAVATGNTRSPTMDSRVGATWCNMKLETFLDLQTFKQN